MVSVGQRIAQDRARFPYLHEQHRRERFIRSELNFFNGAGGAVEGEKGVHVFGRMIVGGARFEPKFPGRALAIVSHQFAGVAVELLLHVGGGLSSALAGVLFPVGLQLLFRRRPAILGQQGPAQRGRMGGVVTFDQAAAVGRGRLREGPAPRAFGAIVLQRCGQLRRDGGGGKGAEAGQEQDNKHEDAETVRHGPKEASGRPGFQSRAWQSHGSGAQWGVPALRFPAFTLAAVVVGLLAIPLSRAQPQAPEPPLDVFLLIGQSNMAGRGVVEADDRREHPRIWMLNTDRVWMPAVDPLHADKLDRAGVGLGSNFARTLTTLNPQARIGLVPAAHGGSSLAQWAPGEALYAAAVERTRAALAQGGRLRGILWHQGEAEANDRDSAFTYADRFSSMIARLRADLEAPDVPVIVGQLGEFLYTRAEGGYAFAPAVNVQLATLTITLPRSAFVRAGGLTASGDELHFDSASLRELGRRYAHAWLMFDPDWVQVAP